MGSTTPSQIGIPCFRGQIKRGGGLLGVNTGRAAQTMDSFRDMFAMEGGHQPMGRANSPPPTTRQINKQNNDKASWALPDKVSAPNVTRRLGNLTYREGKTSSIWGGGGQHPSGGHILQKGGATKRYNSTLGNLRSSGASNGVRTSTSHTISASKATGHHTNYPGFLLQDGGGSKK